MEHLKRLGTGLAIMAGVILPMLGLVVCFYYHPLSVFSVLAVAIGYAIGTTARA